MPLQGMPDIKKHDPKRYLDSLHVSFLKQTEFSALQRSARAMAWLSCVIA